MSDIQSVRAPVSSSLSDSLKSLSLNKNDPLQKGIRAKKKPLFDHSTLTSSPDQPPKPFSSPPVLQPPKEKMLSILSSRESSQMKKEKEVSGFSSSPDDQQLMPSPSFYRPRLAVEFSQKPLNVTQHSFLYPKKKNGSMGEIVADVVEDLCNTRMSHQKAVKESIDKSAQLRKSLSEAFYKKLREALEKAKEKENWEFLRNVADFLLCSAGIMAGAAITTVGMTSGEMMTTIYGLEMLFGSMATFTSFYCRQVGYDPQVTAGFAVAGALLTFHGSMMSFSSFNSQLPQQILSGASTLLHCFHTYKTTKVDADITSVQGDLSLLNRDRTRNLDHMQEASGLMKMEDLIYLLEMASTCLESAKESIRAILHLKRK